MLFNSIDFAFFLPIVFILYWTVFNRSLKIQNILIVIASYVFYGWWSRQFLFLIFLSSLIDYLISLGLLNQQNQIKRKVLVCISIFTNLGILSFFKYFNFFINNFVSAFSFFGMELNATSLHIILPVGISFYTFQTMSYSIDVYNRKIEPTRDIISFFAFVSFFPQLVAGPIERAKNLLSQFYEKRVFEYVKVVDGMRQILWGLFKKIVIADNCAKYANLIFNSSENYSGSTLVIGAIFFSFQIYGDFSGYSDIAIGTARLLGFNLMRNFNYPYFSRNIAEFWKRWHISLSTWFRDYLYIPLGGSRCSQLKKISNIFIIFTVSGFWHGANWTFIFWGILNAVYYLIHIRFLNRRSHLKDYTIDSNQPVLKELPQILFTFSLTAFAWIFFRAENMNHAVSYLSGIFSPSLFTIPDYPEMKKSLITIISIAIFLLIEWKGRDQQYAISQLGLNWKKPYRYALYYLMIFVIYCFTGEKQQFIYFQF